MAVVVIIVLGLYYLCIIIIIMVKPLASKTRSRRETIGFAARRCNGVVVTSPVRAWEVVAL